MKRTERRLTNRRMGRREFAALGASLSAGLLAGCTAADPGSSPTGDDQDGSTAVPGTSPAMETSAATGTFRLLISDQPVAIDEFDSLDVSFDRARIFRADAVESPDATDTATDTATASVTASATTTETTTAGTDAADDEDTEAAEEEEEVEEEAEEAEAGEGGFFVLDLGGATVDLTQVVGDKAIGVFEGGLPAGRYAKIELHAAEVDGVVDGESVDVKIPSGKLQIVKPFEVVAGETLSFVFDINVVRKGQSGGYNLLPVIAKSGVAGQDVEVEEVDDSDDDTDEDDDGEDGGPPSGNPDADQNGGRPDDADGNG